MNDAMKEHAKVAENVGAEIGRKGSKLIDVANALEISTEALRLKRNGTTPFTFDEIGILSKYLGVPFTRFVEGVE